MLRKADLQPGEEIGQSNIPLMLARAIPDGDPPDGAICNKGQPGNEYCIWARSIMSINVNRTQPTDNLPSHVF